MYIYYVLFIGVIGSSLSLLRYNIALKKITNQKYIY